MSGTEGICAVVSPRPSITDLYEQFLAPAIEAAGYEPRLAARGSDPIQVMSLRSIVQQARIALIDMRGGEWFSHYAAGVCSAFGVSAVLLTEDQLDLSDGFSAYPSVPVAQEPDDVDWAAKLGPLVSDALRAVSADDVRTTMDTQRTTRGHGAPADHPKAQRGGDYSLDEAEELVVNFLRDGLSEDAIRRLLMDGGFPPSWVEFRLRRRPGW